MKIKTEFLSRIFFGACLALASGCAMTEPNAVHMAKPEEKNTGKSAKAEAALAPMTLTYITTQAQAEALRPGDYMTMTCDMCKTVSLMKVGSDQAHVQMMTVGEKTMCDKCGGMAEVVGTGRGKGKNQEVTHVCFVCAEDVMFCSASKHAAAP
jgi:hypothetical protein